MTNVLFSTGRPVLEELAASHALLAFDFDGTLAPIVDDPAEARMRSATRALLASLSALYRVVVVSGRAQPDALKRTSGVGAYKVLGNYGFARWSSSSPYLRVVEGWRAVLEDVARAFEGVVVEDKVFSLAVHVRRARDKQAALEAVRCAARALDDARVVEGHHVINLLPAGAPHKGSALAREREMLGCESILYVGDDETDEDVFAMGAPPRLVAIRVGAKPSSRAPFYLPHQEDVDELLRILVSLRDETAPAGAEI